MITIIRLINKKKKQSDCLSQLTAEDTPKVVITRYIEEHVLGHVFSP